MNRLRLLFPTCILIALLVGNGCNSANLVGESTQESMVSTPTASPSPIMQLSPTTEPTKTPSPLCRDIEFSSPLTDPQIEYFQDRPYNFLYDNNLKTIENIYSVNRADTTCSPGYPSEIVNVWKTVSGFIVDLIQPDKDLYSPGGDAGGMPFVNVYVKARFVSQNGQEHDYWFRLTGNPPHLWFQLVQWSEIVSDTKDEPGLTAMEIFLSEKNSDGSNSYIDASTMIPNRLLTTHQQFIAIIHVGVADHTGFQANNETVASFINAIEGKEDFPIAPEGFFLPVQAMIVSSEP